MGAPAWIHNRLFKQFLSRFSIQRNKSALTPLLEKADIIRLQELANEHTWSPSSIREVAHPITGNVRSIYLGSGMDYEESRLYQGGDDLRFMNWRLTARTGQRYMKVFREEKRPATFILIDKRASMRFGSKTRLKLTQALRLAGYIAFSASRRHCGVAGVVLDSEPEWFNSCNDDAGIYHFINEASSPCVPAFEVSGTEPSLDYILRLLQKMIVPGSDVCLLSDFTDINDDSRATLLQLALECNVTAVHIYDGAELILPDAGKLYMRKVQDEQDFMVDTHNPVIQQEYRDRAIKQLEKCKNLFESLGIVYTPVRADSEHIDIDMLKRDLHYEQ